MPVLASASLWDDIKKGTADTANAVGGAVSKGAETVTDLAKPDRSRQEIDDMAFDTLNRLFAVNPEAKTLFDKSHGYAVFDTRKMSFIVTTGFGAGVAVNRANGKSTYMKMGTGGVNVGMGAQLYQVVFLFETDSKFNEFVNEGWDAGAGGSAAVWDEGANLGATFKNGLAIYQLTDKGLMLAADLTGTKYWKDDELNSQ
jgi:lipid-binding SYLF domain-containing protein